MSRHKKCFLAQKLNQAGQARGLWRRPPSDRRHFPYVRRLHRPDRLRHVRFCRFLEKLRGNDDDRDDGNHDADAHEGEHSQENAGAGGENPPPRTEQQGASPLGFREHLAPADRGRIAQAEEAQTRLGNHDAGAGQRGRRRGHPGRAFPPRTTTLSTDGRLRHTDRGLGGASPLPRLDRDGLEGTRLVPRRPHAGAG